MTTFQDVQVPEEVFENILIGFHLKCMRFFGYIVSPQERYKRFHLSKGVMFAASLAVFTCLNFIKISRGFSSLAGGAQCCATAFTFLSTAIAIANAYFQRKRVIRMIIFLHKDITELFCKTDKEEERMMEESVKYVHIMLGFMYVPSLSASLIVFIDAFYRTLWEPETVFNTQAVLNGTAEPILIFQLMPFGEVYDKYLLYYFGAFYAMYLTVATIPCWHIFVTCLMKYIILKYAIINKRIKDYDFAKFSLNTSCEELQHLSEKELQYWHTKMCGFCIREQAKLKWFTKELESLIGIPVFVDFVIYSALMCFILFAIAEGEPSNMDNLFLGLYALAMVLLLWLYHWHATLVTTSNDELNSALYCCPWYTFPVNIQKNIILMMMESTRPLKMKALFVEMNLKTLVDIIRGAYSYYSILKNASLDQ